MEDGGGPHAAVRSRCRLIPAVLILTIVRTLNICSLNEINSFSVLIFIRGILKFV
jgi:hypothetical protein